MPKNGAPKSKEKWKTYGNYLGGSGLGLAETA